jgi:hypothetical protein
MKPGAKAAETKLLKMFNEKLQAVGKVELDAVLFANGYAQSGSNPHPAHAFSRTV